MLFDELELTPYAVHFYRDPRVHGYGVEDPLIPDLPDAAKARICIPGGWFTIVWMRDNIRFEYDPKTKQRRHIGLEEDCIWTEWQ